LHESVYKKTKITAYVKNLCLKNPAKQRVFKASTYNYKFFKISLAFLGKKVYNHMSDDTTKAPVLTFN